MYNYEQIEHLLSRTAKNLLKDEVQFEQITGNVKELMANISGYSIEELSAFTWTRTPFIMLIEYFVYNRIDSTTQELTNKANGYWQNAIDILEKNKKSLAISKLGTMEDLYSAEF